MTGDESPASLPDDITAEFITAFRKQKILWDTEHDYYSSKILRAKAYEALVPILKKIIPKANQDTVRCQIHSLKATFRRLLRLYLASKAIVDGEVVYKFEPTSWKFQALRFLDRTVPDVDPVEKPSNTVEIKEEMHHLFKEETGSEYNSDSQIDDSFYQASQYTGKRSRLESVVTEDHNNYHHVGILDEPPEEEFTAIGVNVATKLQRMPVDQRYQAELLINKVLIYGLKTQLTEETDLAGLSQFLENNYDYGSL